MAIGRVLRRVRARLAVATRAALAVAMLGGAALLATGGAKADTFDFNYSGSGLQAMGTFTATLLSPGTYQITGITGERNGLSITGLIERGAFAGNDNELYYPARPGYLDYAGFAYSVDTGTGTAYYGVYYNSGAYYESARQGALTFDAYPVPAPIPGGGLLSFLALGLAGLACRRKRIAGLRRLTLARFKTKPSATAA